MGVGHLLLLGNWEAQWGPTPHSQVSRTALHAPLLPNPKELAAPNLAGPCPTCLRPLSVDKEFKLPSKSATLAPAPTQGAP